MPLLARGTALAELLPAYDVNEVHSIWVAADPAEALRAGGEATIGEMPGVALMLAIRRLPERLLRRPGLGGPGGPDDPGAVAAEGLLDPRRGPAGGGDRRRWVPVAANGPRAGERRFCRRFQLLLATGLREDRGQPPRGAGEGRDTLEHGDAGARHRPGGASEIWLVLAPGHAQKRADPSAMAACSAAAAADHSTWTLATERAGTATQRGRAQQPGHRGSAAPPRDRDADLRRRRERAPAQHYRDAGEAPHPVNNLDGNYS